ncbi:HOL1 substrate-H+ antiporter [Fusarium albosuccineum]|uniref:HOL1 substrate-H+ antiporter n=1 Tax=Fusarium albosuccineum TaxID=1237068 RepID=A0A8H4LAR3_9HYPO|nr:HOL1 substrate-H+ antiporter [Fusarium albosuccineum]
MPTPSQSLANMADQIEAIPGTVHLVDSQGNMESQHAQGAEHDIVLVPAPSSHPDDPLNWSPRRKYLSAFCMAAYVLVIGICSSALYSTLGPLSDATGLTYNDLNSGTGYMFLFFGWGCIIWQAIAVQYGKRPVYLLTTAGTLGVMVWQPYVRSNGEWIATKILQGIFGAPMESLAEITVSDVFFTHERGKFIALYVRLATAMALLRSSWGSSTMDKVTTWQYWCAIFCAVLLVIIFFFMEETKFDRAKYMTSAHIEGQALPSTTHTESGPDSKNEADDKQDGDEDHARATTTLSRVSGPHDVDVEFTKKSRLARLKPIERKNLRGENRLVKLISRPILLLAFPIIVYSGFIYGCNIVWLSVLNATESMVLSNRPYSMSTSTVGLTFIAPLVGTTLACVYTGIFGDRFIVKMARRNNGFMEAEHRLWPFLPSLILIPFGCILFGVGAYHQVHWFGIVFAMGVISFTTTAGSQMSIAYCIDCYRDLASEALATAIIIRNTMSFGIGYGAEKYWNTVKEGADLDVNH